MLFIQKRANRSASVQNILIGIAIAVIFLPAVIALAACGFYTVRYTRLRWARTSTMADYLHDFAGSWTRLLTRAGPSEEQRCLRKMLLTGVCFVSYVSVLMAVATALK